MFVFATDAFVKQNGVESAKQIKHAICINATNA